MSVLTKVFSVKNENVHKVITILGLKIKIKSKKLAQQQKIQEIEKQLKKCNEIISKQELEIKNQKCEIKKQVQKLNSIKEKQECELNLIKEKQAQELNLIKKANIKQAQEVESIVNRITPQPILKSTVYHLADNCNLNCWGCDHFAPLAEKNLADLNSFKSDMKRFSELLNQKLDILKLMGGEPLLNEQIIDFMETARNYFPKTKIEIVTNAILLPAQKDSFWQACNKNNIVIVITKYPIEINYEKIQEKAQKFDVKIEYYGSTGEILKTSYHIPLDIKGQQNPVKNFISCFHANNCVMLKNGKLYPCTVAPNIEHFNKHFGYNLELTEKDGIDIYKAKTGDELLEFLSRPMPFCRYCNVKKRTFNHPWQLSKKDISEWLITCDECQK